jgi:hypothetical protein
MDTVVVTDLLTRFVVQLGVFHSGITALMYGVSKVEPSDTRSAFSYETHSFLILPSACTALYFAVTNLMAKGRSYCTDISR